MKKAALIVADDKEVRITVKVLVRSRNGLTRDEVMQITRKAARITADGIKALPYTDFGAENTRVEV